MTWFWFSVSQVRVRATAILRGYGGFELYEFLLVG